MCSGEYFCNMLYGGHYCKTKSGTFCNYCSELKVVGKQRQDS